MLKEIIGRKVSEKIESSRYGDTRTGKIAANLLDEEKFHDTAFSAMDTFTGDLNKAEKRRPVLLISVAVILVSWLCVLFLPGIISRIAFGLSLIFSKGGLLLLVPAFSATLYGAYAVMRIFFPENSSETSRDDFMKSYHDSQDSIKTWRIWIVASATAAINAVLLFLTYFYVSGEWQSYWK